MPLRPARALDEARLVNELRPRGKHVDQHESKSEKNTQPARPAAAGTPIQVFRVSHCYVCVVVIKFIFGGNLATGHAVNEEPGFAPLAVVERHEHAAEDAAHAGLWLGVD